MQGKLSLGDISHMRKQCLPEALKAELRGTVVSNKSPTVIDMVQDSASQTICGFRKNQFCVLFSTCCGSTLLSNTVKILWPSQMAIKVSESSFSLSVFVYHRPSTENSQNSTLGGVMTQQTLGFLLAARCQNYLPRFGELSSEAELTFYTRSWNGQWAATCISKPSLQLKYGHIIPGSVCQMQRALILNQKP